MLKLQDANKPANSTSIKNAFEFHTRNPQVLALELVKILLENSGPVFRHLDKFVAAIKQYLCLSLLKNVTSSISQAQALTCSIFFTLLTKFRHSLKAEIGVFFPMILLRAVEPATTGATPNNSGRRQWFKLFVS